MKQRNNSDCYYHGSVTFLLILILGSQQCSFASSSTYNRIQQSSSSSSFNLDDQCRQKDSLSSFLQDLTNLSKLENELILLTPTESNRDSSYTKAWMNEDWELHQVRSLRRYKRHLKTWFKSPTARAVTPAVMALSCWALLVQYLANNFDSLGRVLSQTSFTKGIASFGGPISLLLALRTNTSLTRLLEARSSFGKMVRATKSLASLTATYIGPIHKEKALLLGRYLSIYGFAMKGLFRQEEDGPLVQAILPPNEADWMLKQKQFEMDSPTCIHFRMRSLIADIIEDIPLAAANAMEDRISVLESALGVTKRLFASPIPPTYTRHTSRVLCLYLGLLPFALVSSRKTDIPFILSVLVTIATTAYVFVGIDEIGVEIENPFPLLPMHSISKMIQKNVFNQLRLMEDMPAP